MILAAAPDRVCVAQPEWRRESARREIDEDAGFFRAQVLDETNGGVEVAVERAARNRVRHVAGAVELELVYAVVAHHAHARLVEALVVLRPREREPALVRLEALLPAV